MSYHSSDDEGTYRKEFGRGHIYILDGSRVTGVTTILNALPKPLAKWGAEKTAELAINEWDRLSQLPVSARLRELEGAPWRDLEFSAAKGTKIHQYAEARARGTTLTLSADVAGYVRRVPRSLMTGRSGRFSASGPYSRGSIATAALST